MSKPCKGVGGGRSRREPRRDPKHRMFGEGMRPAATKISTTYGGGGKARAIDRARCTAARVDECVIHISAATFSVAKSLCKGWTRAQMYTPAVQGFYKPPQSRRKFPPPLCVVVVVVAAAVAVAQRLFSVLRCLALSEGMNKHIYPPSLSVQERELLLPCDGYTMQTSLAITLSCSPCLLHPLPNCFFSLPYTLFCLIKSLFFLSTSLVSFA